MRDFWNEFVQAHNARKPQGQFADTVVIMPDSISGFRQDMVPGTKELADFLVKLQQAGVDVKMIRTSLVTHAVLTDMVDYGLDPRFCDFERVSFHEVFKEGPVGLLIGESDLPDAPVANWHTDDGELQEFAAYASQPVYPILLPEGFKVQRPAAKPAQPVHTLTAPSPM